MGFADLQMNCVDNRNPWADLIARVVVITYGRVGTVLRVKGYRFNDMGCRYLLWRGSAI